MIFDCFTFFNENDLLEIRFNILKDIVNKFVIIEATKTFTGKEKDGNKRIVKILGIKFHYKHK